MIQRANYIQLAPEALQILIAQETYLKTQFNQSNQVSVSTWELIKLRVSLINQCAYCIDMHTKDALELGETYQRIIGLSAWRDMPLYSSLERVALNWAELVTSGQQIDDKTYGYIVDNLGEKAVVDLTIAINAINSWNRIVKVFKPEVGTYKAS